MFRRPLLYILILTMTLWFSIWAIAQEEIFVDEDSEGEDYVVGKDAPEPWVIVEPEVKVAQMGAQRTSKCLVINDEGPGRANAYVGFPTQSEGIMTMEYFARVDEQGAPIPIYSGLDGSFTISFRFIDGNFDCNNGGAWQKGPAYELKRWYHIAYVVNLDKQEYDIFIDDMEEPAMEGVKFRPQQPISLNQLVTWSAIDNAASIHYIDEVRIYPGPYVPKSVEPSGKLAATWGGTKSEY